MKPFGFTSAMILGFPPPWFTLLRRTTLASVVSVSSLFTLSACEDPEDGEDSDGADSDDSDDGDDGDGNVVLQDDNNYSNQSSLSIPVIQTAPGDFEVCWGDIVKDIQCHDLVPEEDIDAVALLRLVNLTYAEAEDALSSDELDSSNIGGYLALETAEDADGTCAQASSMTLAGTPVDIEEQYVESDEVTYLLLFNTGTTLGVGARTMTFLEPTSASNNTQVSAAADSCDILDFSASLSDSQPASIPIDGPWVIDWSNVTTNGSGNPLIYEKVDGVLVAFYEGLSVAELEEQILDLEYIYTGMWELETSGGRSADLADAVERDGSEAFPGFDNGAEGTWVLGLMCSTCQNPAPLVLTVLEPTAGEE